MKHIYELLKLVGKYPTWNLVEKGKGDFVLTPFHSEYSRDIIWTITSIPETKVPDNRLILQTEKMKEREKEIFIDYYSFANGYGIYHHLGSNWLLWDTSKKHYFLSTDRDTYYWNRIRYWLRHFITEQLLVDDTCFPVHGALGKLRCSDSAGVLVVGKSGSGKSYLMSRLMKEGIISECLEEDCTVMNHKLEASFLSPREDQSVSSGQVKVNIVISLEKSMDHVWICPIKEIENRLREDPAPLPLYWFSQKKANIVIFDSTVNCYAIKAPIRDKTDEIIAKIKYTR